MGRPRKVIQENVSSQSPGEPEQYEDFTVVEDMPITTTTPIGTATIIPQDISREDEIRNLLADYSVNLLFDKYGSVTMSRGDKAESINMSAPEVLIKRAAQRVSEKT